MTIRPTSSGTSPRIEGSRGDTVTRSGRKSERAATTGAPSTSSDEVRISAPARQLLAQSGPEAVPQGEVSPDRLLTLSERIAQGHYDQPEIIDAVLRRLSAEL